MIRASGLQLAIGHSEVLRGVSLDVASGEFVAVVGANGAGKTSLLRALSGLLPLRAGEVLFGGDPVGRMPAYERARRGLVHVPQGRQVVPQLSVEENLLIGAEQLPGLDRHGRREALEVEYQRFPILRERRHVAAGALSGGEQQMVAVSRGLMMRPRILMLDEPSLGLAPRIAGQILQTLRELVDDGIGVLLVEQAAVAALKMADRGAVLQRGRIVLQGSGRELLADAALVRGFLG